MISIFFPLTAFENIAQICDQLRTTSHFQIYRNVTSKNCNVTAGLSLLKPG